MERPVSSAGSTFGTAGPVLPSVRARVPVTAPSAVAAASVKGEGPGRLVKGRTRGSSTPVGARDSPAPGSAPRPSPSPSSRAVHDARGDGAVRPSTAGVGDPRCGLLGALTLRTLVAPGTGPSCVAATSPVLGTLGAVSSGVLRAGGRSQSGQQAGSEAGGPHGVLQGGPPPSAQQGHWDAVGPDVGPVVLTEHQPAASAASTTASTGDSGAWRPHTPSQGPGASSQRPGVVYVSLGSPASPASAPAAHPALSGPVATPTKGRQRVVAVGGGVFPGAARRYNQAAPLSAVGVFHSTPDGAAP